MPGGRLCGRRKTSLRRGKPAVSEHFRIEKATIRDAAQIHELVSTFAALGEMLPAP